MIKILWGMLLGVSLLFGAGVKWEKNYASAIAKAKSVNKPVMFIVSNHNCRFCIQFESTTLSDPKVAQKLNADFVNAIVYIDEDPVFPRQLFVPGTPGTWFLKPSGEPMFEPVMGAVGTEDFLAALDTVKKEYASVASKK